MIESIEHAGRKARLQTTEAICVLIVDDDPDFLDLLSFEMTRIPNVRLTVARNPEEALHLLGTRSFDLVVSDWALNGSTAPEVLSTADDLLRDERNAPDPVPHAAKTPVMFMSGSEKVNETRVLHSLKHFEPVSFILKRCGPPLIGQMAAHILDRFVPTPGTHLC